MVVVVVVHTKKKEKCCPRSQEGIIENKWTVFGILSRTLKRGPSAVASEAVAEEEAVAACSVAACPVDEGARAPGGAAVAHSALR